MTEPELSAAEWRRVVYVVVGTFLVAGAMVCPLARSMARQDAACRARGGVPSRGLCLDPRILR